MISPIVALLVATAVQVQSIAAVPAAPLNFFDALIVGDWGLLSADQGNVAAAMNQWAQASSSEAIISVGDNFYKGAASLAYDGVQSANDVKFQSVWSNVFNGGYIKNLPWWSVMGNHDWNNAGSALSELQHQSALWVMPDFFYTKRVEVDIGVFATFIFIETDLLFYGYAGYSAPMLSTFTALGWTAANNTIAKQLAWIENAIASANNDAFVFLVGHHETYTCVADANANMQTILTYVNKWNVTGYMNGHQHTLAGYVTNNGSTLQIQAGSGGKIDSACAPLDNTFSAGTEVVNYGFAHLRLDKTGAYVNFVNETAQSVLALSVKPRVPVTGVAPQPMLAPSADTSVHYTKPAVAQPASIDYLVVGDWGNVANLANMKNVAAAMDSWATQQNSSAVISLGDNFYGKAGTLYSYEGVQSVNDPKFTGLWSNVFNGPTLKNLPWWMILGNHDWYLKASQVYEMQYQNVNWNAPDFFYTKRVQVDTGVWASFIFIETDLFQYGYAASKNDLAVNFAMQGWNAASRTVEKQLAWIDNALAQANNDQYVFVIGHHPDFDCGSDVTSSFNMTQVTGLINKWSASAYFSGHHHTMAYYYTNGGNTLQIQNGAGGNADAFCLPASKAPGQELPNTFGFSHLNVNAQQATVDFITENNVVAFSASVGPRQPVTGVSADTTWLPTSLDPAVHFVAPPCNPIMAPSATNICPPGAAAPAGLAALAAAGPSANALMQSPVIGANVTASVVSTCPASLGTVNAAQVAASTISTTVPLTAGSVTQVLGGSLPVNNGTGVDVVFVTLTSSSFFFGPAYNLATYNADSAFNITSMSIPNGAEFTYVVPAYLGSVWYAYNMTASSQLIVSVNSGTSVLATVSFPLMPIFSIAKRQGNSIVMTQSGAAINAIAGPTSTTTVSASASATTTVSTSASATTTASASASATGSASRGVVSASGSATASGSSAGGVTTASGTAAGGVVNASATVAGSAGVIAPTTAAGSAATTAAPVGGAAATTTVNAGAGGVAATTTLPAGYVIPTAYVPMSNPAYVAPVAPGANTATGKNLYVASGAQEVVASVAALAAIVLAL
ncbi:Tartrate-resistant acid phosphatase type 5 [Podochytrium sp. JEL0797]|nr:Tartrate-resistant acid phosphatase type 5 [Podochytrium sp. JEL0797]